MRAFRLLLSIALTNELPKCHRSHPGATSRAYVLQTTFPNRDLTDEKQTIKDAKLQNSVVTMRYT